MFQRFKIISHCIPLASLLLVGFFFSACASPEEDSEESSIVRISWPTSDRADEIDSAVPPFELFNQTFLGSGRFNGVFWLDFAGADVTAQESFIVANAGLPEASIPPFEPADIRSTSDRQELIDSIVDDLLPLFPDVDIRLTTRKPLTRPYSRVHIGGENFTGRPGVLGVAPLDLGNRSGSDILFVYPAELRGRNPEAAQHLLVNVIAHEIAHALGARHIRNDFAIMNPIARLTADSFDRSGVVVDSPNEVEHSLDVLVNSVGSRTQIRQQGEIPNIVNLAAFATDGVIQYTVIARDNIAANPHLNLADYRYQWSFEGQRTEGSSVLMTFDDREDHLLELTVIDDDSGTSKTFQFSVGRRK
jgi:hypothetical protein